LGDPVRISKPRAHDSGVGKKSGKKPQGGKSNFCGAGGTTPEGQKKLNV